MRGPESSVGVSLNCLLTAPSISDQVAIEVHRTLSSKLKRSVPDRDPSSATAAGTPRPSPREGAVKISQAVLGRGLVDEGGDDDDDDDDSGDGKGGVTVIGGSGIGLLGSDYDSDGDQEPGNEDKAQAISGKADGSVLAASSLDAGGGQGLPPAPGILKPPSQDVSAKDKGHAILPAAAAQPQASLFTKGQR